MSLTEPLWPPDSDWKPPKEFPRLSGIKQLGLDCETKDPNLLKIGPGSIRKDGYVVGVSLATDDRSWYFPIAHEGGGNLDKDKTVRWLREVLGDEGISKIGANLQYDLEWLRSDLQCTVQGPLYDIQLAEPLLDEDRTGGYSLENLSRWYLKEGKEEGKLKQAADAYGIDAKSDLWRLHSKHVGPYAEMDAQLPVHIFAQQSVRLRQHNLWDIFELESSLIPVVLDMRFLGVRVDIERAYDLSKQMLSEETELLQLVKKLAGFDFNPWSSQSIAKAFDKLDIDYPLTEKGNPSITRAWLDNHTNTLCQTLVRYRVTSKIRRDFVQGVILDQNIDGRIHAQFHQLRKDLYGTRSGRFSSSHPNLQQIPARDLYYGPLIRSLFIPDKKHKWGKFDYSQQEPRLTVHYGELCGLNGAEATGDVYRENPNADFHKIVADMTGLPRQNAKTINLGLAYGMGKIRLASELQSTISQAEAMLEKYHEKMPFIRQLANKCHDKSMTLGEIVTICGRKRRLDNKSHHKALNSLIQGSAADMTKKAMFECHKEGWTPHMQVHDELCFSLSNPKNEAPRIKEIMENVVKLSVPVLVDCDIGNNWACKEKK
ncbi:MAG TPA: hypothetical protein EYG21_00815 [Nitrospinaceae bacterium]|jgi:DNA polymerase I-like protein with 3'-5' exonuclease and polymerase domains|nr:hypothetical protein [Nitrospinaceae bacterium]